MGKKQKILYVESDGKNLTLLSKEKPSFPAHVKKMNDEKTRHSHLSIFLYLIGILVSLSIFTILFAYFYYDKDVNKLLGFFGFVITIDLISISMMIPFIGSIISFYQFFWGNEILLNFYQLEETLLTTYIGYFMFISTLIINIYLSILYIYSKIHWDEIEKVKTKRDGKFSKKIAISVLILGVGIFFTVLTILRYFIDEVFATTEIIYLIVGVSAILFGVILLCYKPKK